MSFKFTQGYIILFITIYRQIAKYLEYDWSEKHAYF